MPLKLAVGADEIPLNALTDLDSAAENPTILKILQDVSQYWNQPLSAVPQTFNASLSYISGERTWTPQAAPVTFTLSGGVSGSISVLSAGDLFSYTDGFPTVMGTGLTTTANESHTVAVSVPAGKAFLELRLEFQLSAGAGFTYASGAYGVVANGAAESTLIVAFYKACSSDVTLGAAVEQALQAFVLPLHPLTLKRLQPGDYLLYEYQAKLQLGFGGTVGLPSFSYAAQYAGEISQLAGAVSVNASVEPSVQAGAKLSFSADYSGTFETVVWVSDENTAHLHLFRAKSQNKSLGLSLALEATAGVSANLELSSGAALASLTEAMDPALSAAIATVFRRYEKEVDGWATEVNTRVAGWLAPLNNGNSALDLSISGTGDRFILADYTIDLRQPYTDAWKKMLEGNFYGAMALQGTGVVLSAGSGLESLYSRTGAIHLNLFGRLNAQWSDALVTNAELIYIGGNIFHLTTAVGRNLLTSINGHQKAIEIYFAADVDLTDVKKAVRPNLHVILQAVNNRKAGVWIGQAVSHLASGSAGSQLAATVSLMASQPGTTERLHLIFTPDAYAKLQASDTRAKPMNEAQDQVNYAAFARASSELYAGQPFANFAYTAYGQTPFTYAIWRAANIASNDSAPPPNAQPKRHDSGGYNPSARTAMEQFFGMDMPDSSGRLAFYALEAGSSFMNFCEDLVGLANGSDTGNAATWNDLVSSLQKIIKSDVNVDFIPSTGLALAYLSGTVPKQVSGPAADLPPGTSIDITMTY